MNRYRSAKPTSPSRPDPGRLAVGAGTFPPPPLVLATKNPARRWRCGVLLLGDYPRRISTPSDFRKSCFSAGPDGPAGTSHRTLPLWDTSSTSPAATTCACLMISTRSPAWRDFQLDTAAEWALRLDRTAPRAFI